jgi:hypothetical protein
MKHISLLLLLLMTCPVFSQWTNVGLPGISSGWSTNNFIAADTSGAPVIAYNTGNSGFCLRFDGIQWVQVGAASFNFPVADILKLLIDKDNNIYLFFYSHNNYTSCIKYDGITWGYVGGQSIVAQLVNHFTAALDNNNIPYCAFISGSGIQIKSFNGNSWEPESTIGISGSTVFLSMAFDFNNKVYLAYCDVNFFKVKFLVLNGDVWTPLGNPDFYTGFAQNFVIVITSQNDIYLAFNDNGGVCLKLDQQTGTWGSAGLDPNIFGITDMIMDELGNIYIAASQNDNRARCFKYDGTNWSQLGNDGISEGEASYLKFAHIQGDLFASYNDFDIGKAVVKKYPNAIGIDEHKQMDLFTVYPNPANDRINILSNSQKSGTFRIKIFNSAGMILCEQTSDASIINNEIYLNNMRNGVYYVSFENDGFRETKKFVKLSSN